MRYSVTQNLLRLFGAIALLFAIYAPFVTAQKSDSKDDSPAATAADLESFDTVWKTIRETHWDLDEEAWDKTKDKLRPKVEAAETRSEARTVITELINSLDQSHFGLIPAESYEVLNETEKSGEGDKSDENGDRGTIGVDIRLVDGVLTVVRVAPDSAAAKAGVETGWTISKIGKRSHKAIIKAATEATEKGPIRMDTLVALMTNRATTGDLGKTTKVPVQRS